LPAGDFALRGGLGFAPFKLCSSWLFLVPYAPGRAADRPDRRAVARQRVVDTRRGASPAIEQKKWAGRFRPRSTIRETPHYSRTPGVGQWAGMALA
jgi:hypothetical protein